MGKKGVEGVELIRNIVRPRKETSPEPYSDEGSYGDLTLKSRITKMKDRKRKQRNAPTSPIPAPLDEPEDHDPIRLVHFAPTPQIIETSKGLEEQGGGKEEQCTTTEVDNNKSKIHHDLNPMTFSLILIQLMQYMTLKCVMRSMTS